MTARLTVICVLMGCTALLVHWRDGVEHTPSAPPLTQWPRSLGSWSSVDVPIETAVLRILGDGQFLNRLYYLDAQKAESPIGTPVSLFIAYFPSQRTGTSIHSPQNCLPGAGWSFESSGKTTITDTRGQGYRVGDYMITDGTNRQEVLYWYRSHGRTVASDYAAKVDLIVDAARLNRTDGALVRVITPVGRNETDLHAHQRLVSFASLSAPLLPSFIPD